MASLADQNKTIARNWFDLVSAGEVEEICRLTAPTWTMQGGPPNLPSGHAGVRELFRFVGSVEQQWTIDDMIAEGDKVAVRATCTCTQDSFLGIDGRGKQQVFAAIFIHRITGGLIQETWRSANDLGRVFQLGARLVTGEG